MNIKIFSVLIVFVLFFSCKKTVNENTKNITSKTVNQDITESDIAKLNFIDFILDEKTEKAIEEWAEYYQLQDVIADVKKGELSFFNDNEEVITTLLKDLKENIPEKVNTNATLARIQVLETKLLKLKSLSNLTTTNKEELNSTIKEFLESFSNLNFQMNKKLEKDSRNIQKP